MDVHPIDQYPKDVLENLLAAIPFYRQVRLEAPSQCNLLMRYSRLVEYRAGEVVVAAAHTDAWLFCLLKGRLAVYAGKLPLNVQRVNTIGSGEVFGDVAALLEHPRSATVIVDTVCKHALVFCTDFSVFGALQDFTTVTLNTKLLYYRNTTRNLRWKLEVYRASYPECSESLNHYNIPLFAGLADTVEELLSLHQQACDLARLLLHWNAEFMCAKSELLG